MHTYVCERRGKTVYVVDRKTAPRMGQVITAYGSKWSIWYIQDGADGYKLARLEPAT